MLKVKAGDLDKMALLFERYHRPLYGFLFHMTYQRETSEDLVQQVFYKMLKYRHTFTGDSTFISWMYGIARNTIIDEAKKNKKHLHDSAEDMAEVLASDASTDGQLERKQEKQELHRAMNKLSSEQREILTMSRFQELKHQEIAQIMNITEGAVKVRVHRAMCELKSIYTKMVS